MAPLIQVFGMQGGAVALLAAAVILVLGVGMVVAIVKGLKAVMATFREVAKDAIVVHEKERHAVDEAERRVLLEQVASLRKDLEATREEFLAQFRELREALKAAIHEVRSDGRAEVQRVEQGVAEVRRRCDEHLLRRRSRNPDDSQP